MFRFAIKNMLVRKTKMLLVVLSVVLSASVALLAFNVSRQVREGIVGTTGYYDIIIGPAGSSTQLAMNTMFFTDQPLGTIPFDVYEQLRDSPFTNSVVPFTMGDSFNGSKIVGTTADYLTDKELSKGVMFSDTFDAVIGSAVASRYGLDIGDDMITSHGLMSAGAKHDANPLKVVGILKETHTAYDNAVFTHYESVWALHEHGEEHDEGEEAEVHEHEHEGSVCAVLVKSKSAADYFKLEQAYASDSSLLFINPSTVLREVLSNVDLSSKIVYALCAVILIMNIFVITVITLLNMYDAKKEIALMRLIGIGMGRIQRLYMIQNAFAGLLSTCLALLASRFGLKLISGIVSDMGIVLNAWRVYSAELLIMAAVFLISVLPTVICVRLMARKGGLDT